MRATHPKHGRAIGPQPSDSLPTNAPMLIEGLDEAVLIADAGNVVGANAAARRLLGQNIVGAALAEAIAHPGAVEALERGVGADEGVELTGIGGSRRHWLMRMAPLTDGSSLIRFVDHSEARAAERMRVDFVANASHELRTPLATLIGYAETLRDHDGSIDGDTRDRFLGVIHDEARRMQRVVEDLISLSRIEAEKFSPPTDAVSLPPLIDQAFDSAALIARERQSELACDLAPDLPDIAGDRGEILQLLDNLVTNALRYGEPGTAVRVGAMVEGTMVKLSVADQGEGIPAEHIPRVTERFYRVDTSRSRAIGGTGLGLSIVKHIVERHRGRLKIASEPGAGTTVTVLFPVARA